jgi:hypothetical protein
VGSVEMEHVRMLAHFYHSSTVTSNYPTPPHVHTLL